MYIIDKLSTFIWRSYIRRINDADIRSSMMCRLKAVRPKLDIAHIIHPEILLEDERQIV